jgi:hypothetical protein
VARFLLGLKEDEERRKIFDFLSGSFEFFSGGFFDGWDCSIEFRWLMVSWCELWYTQSVWEIWRLLDVSSAWTLKGCRVLQVCLRCFEVYCTLIHKKKSTVPFSE